MIRILFRLAPLLLLPALLLAFILAPLALLRPGDELLLTSVSPGGSHCLEVHRINPGATEPYYIHVYRTGNGSRERIYAVRGEDDAEIEWLSEDVVRINQVTLDLGANETFTADARAHFDVVILLAAEDVAAVSTTVHVGGSARATQEVSSARGGVLVQDRRITHRMTLLNELHHDDDLARDKVGLTVTVTPEDGRLIPLPMMQEWTAALGGSYTFTLTGSPDAGYELTPSFEGCTSRPR